MVVYRNGFKWNPDNEKILKDMWMQGIRAALIAKEVGTGKNSVIGKARRLGLPSHPSGNNKPKPNGVSVTRTRAISLPKINPLPLKEMRIMLPAPAPSSDPKDWIPFSGLSSKTCRAILGKSPTDGSALYCNNEAMGGFGSSHPYCEFHDKKFRDRTWRPRGRDRDALQRLAALQK